MPTEVYICKIKLLGFPWATFNREKAEDWVNEAPEDRYFDTVPVRS